MTIASAAARVVPVQILRVFPELLAQVAAQHRRLVRWQNRSQKCATCCWWNPAPDKPQEGECRWTGPTMVMMAQGAWDAGAWQKMGAEIADRIGKVPAGELTSERLAAEVAKGTSTMPLQLQWGPGYVHPSVSEIYWCSHWRRFRPLLGLWGE